LLGPDNRGGWRDNASCCKHPLQFPESSCSIAVGEGLDSDAAVDRDPGDLEGVVDSACPCRKFLFRKLLPYGVVRLR